MKRRETLQQRKSQINAAAGRVCAVRRRAARIMTTSDPRAAVSAAADSSASPSSSSSASAPPPPPAPARQHTNRLIHETSPYLLQHAHIPVDWYPWGPEALECARAEDRPIFLSVGYST